MNRREEYQDERWKERAAEIRKLDDHRCCRCGRKDVELHVHHLAYPPPPFHIWEATDNELVTLCKECHEEVHRCNKRPIFTDSRSLFVEANTIECKHDCEQCKYNVQEYLLDPIESLCFEIDGYCQECGGEGCCFKEAIRCKECQFKSYCNVSDNEIACARFEYRMCDGCGHCRTWIEDNEVHSECTWDGRDTIDCDPFSCRHFYSRFKNMEEKKEYYKEFD